MKLADMHMGRRPELWLLYAVPNGGDRNAIVAKKLKAEGVKPGVPDLCLPVARGDYHGLYVEMKRVEGGRLSKEQRDWLEELKRQGYRAVSCKGADAAWKEISSYLEG